MNLPHRNAAADSTESLRESLASLEQQLVSLYADRERENGVTFAADESLAALYEDKQRLSARTIAELRESVENLTAQLADVYALREAGGDADSSGLQDTIDGLNQQLHALYEEREEHALNESGANLPDSGVAALHATLKSFEAQLAAFYAEGEGLSVGHREAACMAESLTEQVAALLEERNDLAQECESLKSDIRTTKRRAREMIDALVSQSLN
jgi:chromosome segregation ATPase